MKNVKLWLTLAVATFVACHTPSPGDVGVDQAPGGLFVAMTGDHVLPAAPVPHAGMEVAYVIGADSSTVSEGLAELAGIKPTRGERLVARLPQLSPKLRKALEGQRRLLRRQSVDKSYTYGGRQLTVKDFVSVIDGLLEAGGEAYVPTAISVAKRNAVTFTAYYSPDLAASRTKTEIFRYPILRLPSSDSARGATRAELNAGRVVDFDEYTLAWVAHPLDVYMLQLQGSGYVTFPDGERVYLAFARSNGRKFESIKSALASSHPTVARKSVKAIRAWMSQDLEARGGLVDLCDNYVFFRARDSSPKGSAGVPLIPMVSVAADPDHYPPGAVLLAEVPVPGNPRIKETRILLVQDTGAAIKGVARLDLYTGIGAKALDIARLSSHVGEVYVLAP